MKIHLIISAEPIENGRDLTAQCGELVPNATAIPLSESGEMEPRSTIGFCKRCFDKKYFYMVMTAQEAKDSETEL